MNHPTSKSAFSLIELIMVLSLIGVAMLIEGRLFKSTMSVIGTTATSQNEQARLDRVTAALREDVWNAANIEVPDPHTIILTQSDGSKRNWRFEPAQVTRSLSTDNASSQSWNLAQPLQAERSGPSLIIRLPSLAPGSISSRPFISQILLAESAIP